jgi:hypothetical protein
MFNAKQLKDEWMNANPFKPFRVCLTDGKAYDVPNHDAALITQNYLEVGIGLNDEGIPRTIARCAIPRIVRIEELQAA